MKQDAQGTIVHTATRRPAINEKLLPILEALAAEQASNSVQAAATSHLNERSVTQDMENNIDFYKKQILRLLKKIDNEKFLRRIYISLRDFST